VWGYEGEMVQCGCARVRWCSVRVLWVYEGQVMQCGCVRGEGTVWVCEGEVGVGG